MADTEPDELVLILVDGYTAWRDKGKPGPAKAEYEHLADALRARPDDVLRELGYRQHGFICLDSKCGTWTEDDSECPMGHDTDDPLPAVPFFVKAAI